MDNYPTLKRPKKKLVYPTTITRLPGQWTKDIITLEDVDKMFDDLDSNGEEDFPSPSPEIHIPSKNKYVERDVTPLPPPEELLKSEMTSGGDHFKQQPSGNPELEIDSETPFKAHGPVKTSSPIEGNAGNTQKQPENSALPILFDCEDENQGLEMAETPTEESQHKCVERIESDESFFETLPKNPALDEMSAKKNKTAQTRSKPSSPPAFPESRNELKATAAPVKLSECGHGSSKVKHDMTSFLQKLRDAGQPKPGLTEIPQAKVVPPVSQPEPEDDFLILEDDVPFYVSIPSKNSKSMKEKRPKASSSDTEAKDTAGEGHSADKQQDIEQNHKQPEIQTLTDKTNKKTRNKSSESNSAASDKDHPVLATVESINAKNLSDRSQTKTKKTQSKDDNKPEDFGKEIVDGTPSKKVREKKVKKRLKTLKHDKEIGQRKINSAKQNRRGVRKADSLTDGVEVQNQEVDSERPLDNDVPVSEVNNVETTPKKRKVHSSPEETTDEDIVQGKRKRKQPGEWWIGCPQSSEQEVTEKQPMGKKTKRANHGSNSAAMPVKAATREGKKKQKSSSSDSQKEKAEKKDVKKRKPTSKRPVKTTLFVESDEVFGQPIHDSALDQDSDSSPLLFPHRDRSISSGERVFHKVYQNCASEAKSSLPDCASPMSPEGVVGSRERTKRIRKSPGNWWQVNPTSEDQDVVSQPQQKLKKLKAERHKKKQAEKPTARSPSKPLEGGPKQKKGRSLACFSTVVLSPPVKENVSTLKKQKTVRSPPADDIEADHNVVSIQMDELRKAQESPSQTVPANTSKVIRSGPSSMIGLENYEEDEDFALPSTTVQPALSASDLCCAPLRPLILQQDDKVNLRDWLKSLWPAADKNPDIQPDHFEWYCHRGKAMGILVDMHTGSICNGKMLLGSFMKKPLWVDHSATTVFNLLTSSVSVVVDCNKSHYSAGQSFMVPPGHAYSIHNLNAQPAVLYFTRFFTDELDE